MFHGSTYQHQGAAEKQEQLWSALAANHDSNPWPNTLEVVQLFFESMNLTFAADWDEMPPNELKFWPYKTGYTRTKLAHAQGAVALVEWVSNGSHNYTGLFQGAPSGLIRLSLGGPPNLDPASPSMVPGIGLKFLRSGLEATNLFGLYTLDGQNSFNFFEHDLTSHPPELGVNASYFVRKVRDVFATASGFPSMLGSSDFASFNTNGQAVQAPNFPFRLVFHPTTDYRLKLKGTAPSAQVLSVVAQALVPDTVLYEVYAQATPYSDALSPIGSLILRSPCYTSAFGDKSLFMQHVRMEKDLALRPEWLAATQAIVRFQQSQGHACRSWRSPGIRPRTRSPPTWCPSMRPQCLLVCAIRRA